MIDLDLALKLINELNYKPTVEEILLENSFNRILAEPIIADRDYPPFNRAAMDGIAININDFIGNNFSATITEIIYAGMPSTIKIKKKEAYRIMTGASVPLTANAIIPFEKLSWINDSVCSLNELPKSSENIALKGEDLQKDAILCEKNTKITPYLVGVLASLGYNKIKVVKLPKVLIISSGDELVKIDEIPNEFQIRSSGQYVLKNMLQQIGIEKIKLIQLKDNKEEFKSILEANLNSVDLIITTGGVSAGDNDFIPFTYELLGFEKIFHKVNIKPGKPVWLGKNKTTNCVAFGLPGNPISTQLGFILFIKQFIFNWFGLTKKSSFLFSLDSQVKKNQKLDLFLSCNLMNINNTTKAKIITYNGSGDFISSCFMDGFIKISKGEGFTTENESFEYFSL